MLMERSAGLPKSTWTSRRLQRRWHLSSVSVALQEIKFNQLCGFHCAYWWGQCELCSELSVYSVSDAPMHAFRAGCRSKGPRQLLLQGRGGQKLPFLLCCCMFPPCAIAILELHHSINSPSFGLEDFRHFQRSMSESLRGNAAEVALS